MGRRVTFSKFRIVEVERSVQEVPLQAKIKGRGGKRERSRSPKIAADAWWTPSTALRDIKMDCPVSSEAKAAFERDATGIGEMFEMLARQGPGFAGLVVSLAWTD